MFDYLFGRKQQIDAAPVMRRIIDLTTPNHTSGDDHRLDRRYNRAFPVLLTPWKSGPETRSSLVVFTRDLSDRGIGLVTMQPLQHKEYAISAMPPNDDGDEPYHFLTELRDNRQIAVGLWVAGFYINSVLNISGTRKEVESLTNAANATLQPLNEELCNL